MIKRSVYNALQARVDDNMESGKIHTLAGEIDKAEACAAVVIALIDYLDTVEVEPEVIDVEANMRKLAAHLRTVKQEAFDMSTFREEYDCGTVGCALGHGPYAGIGEVDFEPDWLEYSEKYFELSNNNEVWHWLFSCRWAKFDDTPLGAAKRIEWYLDYGMPRWFGYKFISEAHDGHESKDDKIRSCVEDYSNRK